jgi:hypothetical protein
VAATAVRAGLAELPDLLLGRRRDLALALLLEHLLPLLPASLDGQQKGVIVHMVNISGLIPSTACVLKKKKLLNK